MPLVNGKYKNPQWVNGGPPAIDAEELNAISDTLESLDLPDGVFDILKQKQDKLMGQPGEFVGFNAQGEAEPQEALGPILNAPLKTSQPNDDDTYVITDSIDNKVKRTKWSVIKAALGAIGTGVMSFNGRVGVVEPESGDYTAAMVGARSSTWMPTAAQVGADPAGSAAAVENKLNAKITYGTSDLTAGASNLTTGTVYLVYR